MLEKKERRQETVFQLDEFYLHLRQTGRTTLETRHALKRSNCLSSTIPTIKKEQRVTHRTINSRENKKETRIRFSLCGCLILSTGNCTSRVTRETIESVIRSERDKDL
ncbi:hypothetical protein CHS0354_007143 [Potamilus streckersoni]|uniref:Uncharacterized protein n=1 Tax=Potamilus streckersoni TaxID=2493646 RepID=A0AAE0SMY0_9BIVA|nr:hypothetical protein CHS0354_007143 [Potamilus streckersoni]